MSEALLEASGLVAGYDVGVPIVNGASLRVEPGEIVAILGPNGAGKSTLIKAIAGLVPIAAGSIRLRGRDISRLPAHEMVRRGLGFVPQTDNVFAQMSVEDNLRLAAGILEARLRRARIDETLAFFPDLSQRRGLQAERLSGGQRQMLAVARALVVSPSVLILDEPSAGLVEQNARAALAIADRGVILAEGRERHEGPAAALLGDPAIAQLYLGGRRAVLEARP